MVSPWCTLCRCWATGGHLLCRPHIKWAQHAGVRIRAGMPPARATSGGGVAVGLGTLATYEETAPAGTLYWTGDEWQLPPSPARHAMARAAAHTPHTGR